MSLRFVESSKLPTPWGIFDIHGFEDTENHKEHIVLTLGDVSSDLQDAVGSVIADQVSIAPTVYVDQGASVTVLVDRDVVIYGGSGSQ